jgi:hypothetical protein
VSQGAGINLRPKTKILKVANMGWEWLRLEIRMHRKVAAVGREIFFDVAA